MGQNGEYWAKMRKILAKRMYKKSEKMFKKVKKKGQIS